MMTRHARQYPGRLRREGLSGSVGLADGSAGALPRRPGRDGLRALVRRHGPMVLGVCRRILPTRPTRRTLSGHLPCAGQEGHTIVPDLVGNWLHGVALQRRPEARTAAARRGERERRVREMARDEMPPAETSRECRR